MVKTTLLTAALLLSTATQPPTNETEGPTGSWFEYELLDVASDQTGKCVFVYGQERRYEIAVSHQILSGTYSTNIRRMLLNAAGECRLEDKPAKPYDILAFRTWGLSGYSDQTGTRFKAQYLGCGFSACDSPNVFKSPFSASLSVNDGMLIEEGEQAGDQKRVFRHLVDFQEDLRKVRAVANDVVDAFASGDAEKMRPLIATETFPVSRYTLLNSLPQQAEHYKMIDQLDPIIELSLDPPKAGPLASSSRVAFAYYRATMSTGEKEPFGILLVQDHDGSWKFIPP